MTDLMSFFVQCYNACWLLCLQRVPHVYLDSCCLPPVEAFELSKFLNPKRHQTEVCGYLPYADELDDPTEVCTSAAWQTSIGQEAFFLPFLLSKSTNEAGYIDRIFQGPVPLAMHTLLWNQAAQSKASKRTKTTTESLFAGGCSILLACAAL